MTVILCCLDTPGTSDPAQATLVDLDAIAPADAALLRQHMIDATNASPQRRGEILSQDGYGLWNRLTPGWVQLPFTGTVSASVTIVAC